MTRKAFIATLLAPVAAALGIKSLPPVERITSLAVEVSQPEIDNVYIYRIYGSGNPREIMRQIAEFEKRHPSQYDPFNEGLKL